MLAVRPSSLWPIEQHRGRSRQISHAALARLAAAAQPSSLSPSPSPDYYDSPPSPPRSLEDQVHVAYAHDDIHLAKILLLRLKGIHVTGNDDPRIAEVKDEDFDFCFVPHGRLLDDEDEKALKERQRAESERAEEQRRARQLKDCEKIWEQSKKRLRELKTLAVRRREVEEKRRAEEQRTRYSGEQTRRASRPAPTRTVVAYKLAGPSPAREQEPFVYDFMPQPTTLAVSRPPTASEPKSKSPVTRRPLFDDSRAVPFSEVLTSMKGALFPAEQRPATRLSTSRSKKCRDAELLELLLMAVESDATKGKARERAVPRSGGINLSPCPTCSSLSSSSSSSSSRRSWLSFSSTSSLATTPSSSPPSTPSPLPTKSWFLTPRPSSHAHTTPPPAVTRPCKRCTHRTPVSPSEAPLPVLPDRTPTTTPSTPAPPHDNIATTPATGLLLRFIDLAKGFQHAYISAAMFAVPAPAPNPYATAAAAAAASLRKSRPLYPPGARARSADVRVFLCVPPPVPPPSDTELRPIPLAQLSIVDEDDEGMDVPRTELPDPLPYELRFKPHPVAPRSPFRAVHGAAPAGNVVWRLRNVENPVFLRVKALENETRGLPAAFGYAHNNNSSRFGVGTGVGFGWGMGGARRPVPGEGTLARGREKVLMVAYEGIGRSRLRFEVGEDDVEGRGRRRRRVVERVGEDEGDEWIRGGRRKAMWW